MKCVLNSLLTFNSFEAFAKHVESWIFANGYQVRLYATVHELRTMIELQRKEAQEKKNAAPRKKGKGTRRRRRKVEEWDSEEDSEDGARDAEEDSEGVEANSDDGGDESGVESSSEDERPTHPRSSPIPPPAKRVRRVLDEVTNNERPVRQTTKNGTGRKTQTVAEVSQTYAAPYRTTSSRRRGVQ
ncbi:hypothetical protein B0H16DRAFT_1472426 [Mycena metata]|uniref:Uncharacterized protein n=1 Tax=Mycena metata TaxID=1033252 RepID=A0AAD7MML6_9AGAR|nr:hypothetical protein B0H16DRAFT_1472426 [Mycena metata]